MDIDFESNVHMGHIPSYEPEDFCVVQCRDVFGNTPLMYALGYRQPKAFSKSRTTIIAKLKDIDKSQGTPLWSFSINVSFLTVHSPKEKT